jgi:hypothetical protein
MRRGGLAALVAVLACATSSEQARRIPPSFRAVRSLVLVRSAEGHGGHGRDALDGLDETLRSRGYETRILELGAGANPDLSRLYAKLEDRAGTPRGERFGPATEGDAGSAAGTVVAQLGVDAVVTYHRLYGGPPPSRAAVPPVFPGGWSQNPVTPTRAPQGAFAVVDREGAVAIFPWGDPSTLDDPSGAVNAAEAIDLVVRALTGEAPESTE